MTAKTVLVLVHGFPPAGGAARAELSRESQGATLLKLFFNLARKVRPANLRARNRTTSVTRGPAGEGT